MSHCPSPVNVLACAIVWGLSWSPSLVVAQTLPSAPIITETSPNIPPVPPIPQSEPQGPDEIWGIWWAGADLNRVIVVRRTPDGVWWDAAAIKDRFTAWPKEALFNGSWVNLDNIPGWSATWDDQTQLVHLQADASLRPNQVLRNTPEISETILPQINTGAIFLYDGRVDHVPGSTTQAAALQARVFGRFGVLHTGFTWNSSAGGLERLPTYYQYDWPSNATSLEVGDTVSGGLNWSSPYTMTGVKYHRNFGLTPDRVLLSLPTISGSANIPSTIDVLLDNRNQYQGPVDDGPFVIQPGAGLNGAGVVNIVVTDALGRKTVLSRSIYVSPNILAKGTFDFSIEAGVLRGDTKDRVESGSFAYGLSPSLTIEGHAEHSQRVHVEGLGFNYSPKQRYGVVFAAFQQSSGDFGTGQDAQVGYQYVSSKGGFDARHSVRSQNFHTVATAADTSRFLDLNASLNLNLPTPSSAQTSSQLSVWTSGKSGSWGLLGVRRTLPDPLAPAQMINQTSWGLNWAKTFGQNRLNAQATHDNRDGWSGLVAWSRSWGADGRGDMGAQVDFQRGSTSASRTIPSRTTPSAYIQKQVSQDHPWGWSVQAQSDPNDVLVGVRHWTQSAEWTGEVQQTQGVTRQAIDVSGAVAILGGHVSLSRTANDSFLLVETGLPDIPVEFENRPYGSTNKEGFLLIPNVNGWQRQSVRIDPSQLPADWSFEKWDKTVIVPSGRGAVINLTGTKVRPARGTLLQSDGTPWPAGSKLTAQLGEKPSFDVIVGQEGLVFLESLTDNITITSDDGCVHTLTPVPSDPTTGIQELAPNVCNAPKVAAP